MLLGVAHPHTMWVQSILTWEREREAEVWTETESETAEREMWKREKLKEGCQRGKREREDGEAVTQEMEREWGRESALDRSRDRGGGGGGG